MFKTDFITEEYVRTVLKERSKDIHKGDCGRVLVVAGSKGMAGAAVLCGKAAFRAGAGLVKVAIDPGLYQIIQTALPEATCVPRSLSRLNLSEFHAIAIGPGLGSYVENAAIIGHILSEFEKTVVLDADGLNAISGEGVTDSLKNARANVIITPHMGEARRLIPNFSEPDRLRVAEALIDATGAIVVLKGAETVVASGRDGYFINTTGNPGMATGGSGDVLTGIIAAISGQIKSPWDSAKAGVFIHGLAGDIAAAHVGEYGVTAMDIAEATAFAIKKIIGK